MSYKCSICGIEFPSGGTIPYETSYILCDNCAQGLYHCLTCVHASKCELQNYNQPDLYVLKIEQQGDFKYQTRIINPKVLEKVCRNCLCESQTNCKELGTCEKYEMRVFK